MYPNIDLGWAALSVDTNKKSHLFSRDIELNIAVAKILFLTAEKIFSSRIFTCL